MKHQWEMCASCGWFCEQAYCNASFAGRQFDLLPHYPRATYTGPDTAGRNLQIEQPQLLNGLMSE
ncbi:hypothetical protein [Streptomyces europaeiscabiei]|uniref:hypothetical protein n=1 Tax=Streptomyces europaeiscabiei TaxID=146819 RepID=UPI002E1803AB